MVLREEWLLIIINASLKAGKEILNIYNSDFAVRTKTDSSPITEADKRAHQIINSALNFTQLPILSEEGKHADYSTRKNWKQFWMVDPLDGTKEFVNKNGEFTVNIALIENGTPTMGVVFIPTTKTLYFADKLAYKIENFTNKTFDINTLLSNAEQLPLSQNRKAFVALTSRSHINTETKEYLSQLKKTHSNLTVKEKGSSLKLCLIAEGCADIYPRLSPTMEWDIAAGHAIINATGGTVTKLDNNTIITYNKENLLNPSFIVKA